MTYVNCHFARYHFTVCHYIVVVFSVLLFSAIMLWVVVFSVIMLSVILLNVVAPKSKYGTWLKKALTTKPVEQKTTVVSYGNPEPAL